MTRTTKKAARKATGWRGVVEIHPAAELFPQFDPDALNALAADIKEHGLIEPIAMYEGNVLDGRNRLDALERAGFQTVTARGKLSARIETRTVTGDPFAYVASANVHRRHLTPRQRRSIIEKLLCDQPERSDRETAKLVGVDHKTVGKTRMALAARGEIPQRRQRQGSRRRSGVDAVLASNVTKLAKALVTAGHGDVDVTVTARFADGTEREQTAHADEEGGDA